MFKGLTRDEYVNTLRLQFAPMICFAQDEVDILPRGQVDAKITPRFSRENGAIRAVVVATTQVDDHERLVFALREIVVAKLRHSIIGTRVHRFAAMFVRPASGSNRRHRSPDRSFAAFPWPVHCGSRKSLPPRDVSRATP